MNNIVEQVADILEDTFTIPDNVDVLGVARMIDELYKKHVLINEGD